MSPTRRASIVDDVFRSAADSDLTGSHESLARRAGGPGLTDTPSLSHDTTVTGALAAAGSEARLACSGGPCSGPYSTGGNPVTG